MTRADARAAYRVGLERADQARSLGLPNRYGYEDDPDRQRHVDGMAALAEATVAEVLGRAWVGRVFLGRGDDGEDVSGGVQVRWTENPAGSLILHPGETRVAVGVLVLGETYPLRVRGWYPYGDACTPQHWRADVRHPAYFVRQRWLLDMARLREAT